MDTTAFHVLARWRAACPSSFEPGPSGAVKQAPTEIAFNGLGITCADRLEKGRLIAVVGRLRSSEWTTAEGAKRSKLEVVVNNVDFLDRPKTTAPETGEEPF